MTDVIEIRGGGAVAVDTATLRQTAVRFLGAHADLEALAGRIGSLQNMLLVERAHAWDAASAASVLSTRLREALVRADEVAAQLREAAAIYELVELNARHQAAFAAGDTAGMQRIGAQRDAIAGEYPDAMEAARGLEFERTVMWPGELVRQATELGYWSGGDVASRRGRSGVGAPGGPVIGVAVGGGTVLLAATAGIVGMGRIGRDARLGGESAPVALARTPTSTATAPPSLAAAVARIPSSDDGRVRVERYTMADGSRQYAVYVTGTRSAAIGGRDPWDNLSNTQLYSGHRSASFAATVQALEQAGAGRGDVVHAFGFSQGAMITSHLALEGGFDMRTLVSLGSPVDADVGPGTLSVGIRHTDDPIVGLTGGGHLGAVGAPGSFVVERSFDPATGAGDLAVPAHRIEAYTETAALVDASSDSRVDAVRGVFAELADAASVEVFEFGAERSVSPSSSAGGG